MIPQVKHLYYERRDVINWHRRNCILIIQNSMFPKAAPRGSFCSALSAGEKLRHFHGRRKKISTGIITSTGGSSNLERILREN